MVKQVIIGSGRVLAGVKYLTSALSASSVAIELQHQADQRAPPMAWAPEPASASMAIIARPGLVVIGAAVLDDRSRLRRQTRC